MPPSANCTQPFRAANLASVALSSLDKHSSPTFNGPNISRQAMSETGRFNETATPKRKADCEIASKPCAKKQKVVQQEHKISDESFRTTQTQQFGLPQPIGITTGQIPLKSVERWRLWGWRWPESAMRLQGRKIEEAESPMGTSFERPC